LHVGIDPMDFVLGLCIRDRAALASLGRAILSILFLCGAHSDRLCTVAQTEPAAVRSRSLARTLDILSLTADRIRGRFAEGSVGVVFDSTKNDATAFLVIETLQGEEMLSAKRNDSGIVIAKTRASSFVTEIVGAAIWRQASSDSFTSLSRAF